MKKANKLILVVISVITIIGILFILFGYWQIGIGSFILSAIVLSVNKLQDHLIKRSESLEYDVSMSSEIFLAKVEELVSIIESINKIPGVVLKRLDITTYSIKLRDKEFVLSFIEHKRFYEGENIPVDGELESITRNDGRILVDRLLITYSNEKIPMNKSIFVKNAEDFIDLSNDVRKAIGHTSRSIFEITIWKSVDPDIIYKLKFKKHINNIFKSQYTDEIILKTEDEECKLGKYYTTFRLPLKNLKKVIPHVADIIW